MNDDEFIKQSKRFLSEEGLRSLKKFTQNDAILTNKEKMILYCEIELLRLDLKENKLKLTESSDIECFKIFDDIITNTKDNKLQLSPAVRKKHSYSWLFDFLDYYAKFCGIPIAFVTAGILAPLPFLLIQALEKLFVKKDRENQKDLISIKIRTWLSDFMLGIACLSVDVQGAENFDSLDHAMVLFSHTSNADAIYVCRSVPIQQYSFAKMELFCVPIFGWLGYAVGGIPVDRSNKNRAIGALNAIARSSAGSTSICIAPEGTRSSTGNLLEFKKGPFYIWESLKYPIVPMVVYGGFDLYPNKKWVNTSGKVIVRYLKPIYPHEAEDRTSMANLVRRRMLEALKEPPAYAARELTWSERRRSLMLLSNLILFDLFLYRKISMGLDYLPYTINEIIIYSLVLIIVVTVVINIYSIYIMTYLATLSDKKGKKIK